MLLTIMALSSLLTLQGCGFDKSGCAPHGAITLDGNPLVDGSILFLPQGNTKSPSSGAAIVDGKYAVAANKGLLAGSFRVEITSIRKTGKQIVVHGTEKVDEFENIIPARYNTKSELSANIAADKPAIYDFALSSK